MKINGFWLSLLSLFFPLVLSLFPSFFFPVLPLFLLTFLLCCLVLQKSFVVFFFHEPEDIPKTRANNLPFCTASLFLLGSTLCPMPAPSEWLSSQLISNLLYSTLWPPEGAFVQKKTCTQRTKVDLLWYFVGFVLYFFSFPHPSEVTA